MAIKPRALKPHSHVALFAPSFRFDVERFKHARKFLESRYQISTSISESVFETEHYFAGSDERRLNELYRFLTDDQFDGLLMIRGGYGCSRIYPELIARLKRLNKKKKLKPKIVLGYSDLTVLLNGLHQDLGWVTFHGPVLVGRPFAEPIPLEENTFSQTLFSNKALGKISVSEMRVLQSGSASGVLVGGNLALVAASAGTSYEVATQNKILFLEEVTEPPYKVDKMLTQLLHAGMLDRVKAIVFGQMTDCNPTRNTEGTDVYQAIESALGPFLRKKKIPALLEFPAGHGKPQISFPIGCKVEVRVKHGDVSVHFSEAGVR